MTNHLVYRYDVSKTDDGVGGEEGAFCKCHSAFPFFPSRIRSLCSKHRSRRLPATRIFDRHSHTRAFCVQLAMVTWKQRVGRKWVLEGRHTLQVTYSWTVRVCKAWLHSPSNIHHLACPKNKKRLSTPVASLLAMTDNYLIRGLIIKSCILVKSTNSTVLPSSYSVMCMLGRRSTHKSRSTWQWSPRQSENHVWGPYGLRESRWTLLRGDCKGWISSWKYAVGFNLLLFSFFTLSFPTGRGSSSDIVQLTLTWSVLFPIPYSLFLSFASFPRSTLFLFPHHAYTRTHTHTLSPSIPTLSCSYYFVNELKRNTTGKHSRTLRSSQRV